MATIYYKSASLIRTRIEGVNMDMLVHNAFEDLQLLSDTEYIPCQII